MAKPRLSGGVFLKQEHEKKRGSLAGGSRKRVRDAALAVCCETHKIRRYGSVTLRLAFFHVFLMTHTIQTEGMKQRKADR